MLVPNVVEACCLAFELVPVLDAGVYARLSCTGASRGGEDPPDGFPRLLEASAGGQQGFCSDSVAHFEWCAHQSRSKGDPPLARTDVPFEMLQRFFKVVYGIVLLRVVYEAFFFVTARKTPWLALDPQVSAWT